jgi:integrase
MTSFGMTYQSVLAEPIVAYVEAKRAVGCRFATDARALRLLDRFLVARRITTIEAITADVIDEFLASRPRSDPKSYNQLLGHVRRLFERLVAQQIITASPVRALPRRERPRRRPFLFTVPQMRQLLEYARQLPDRNRGPRRGPTYYVIFALLYGLGLRISEVAHLKHGDVDLERQLLWIRNTKFGKSRLVPFGPRLGAVLRAHVERSSDSSPEQPLFSFDGQHRINANSIRRTFHSYLLPRLNLSVPSGTRPPRVHDLRHSFAVGTLLRWYRAGLDPAVRLPHLSTFLGHSNPDATAVYLTITEELLQAASERFAVFAPPLSPEVVP